MQRRLHHRLLLSKQLASKLSRMIQPMRNLPSWMQAGNILPPVRFAPKIAPNLSDSDEGSPPADSAPLLIASMTPALPPPSTVIKPGLWPSSKLLFPETNLFFNLGGRWPSGSPARPPLSPSSPWSPWDELL